MQLQSQIWEIFQADNPEPSNRGVVMALRSHAAPALKSLGIQEKVGGFF